MATERQTVDVDTFSVNSEEASLPEIRRAIAALSKEDYRQLKTWLEEHDWDRWDEQIERDSESGALDFLVGSGRRALAEEDGNDFEEAQGLCHGKVVR